MCTGQTRFLFNNRKKTEFTVSDIEVRMAEACLRVKWNQGLIQIKSGSAVKTPVLPVSDQLAYSSRFYIDT